MADVVLGQTREEIPQPPISSEVWKYILDRTQIPEVLSHVLKGETWVVSIDNGKEVGEWVETGEPLMNQKGVKFFISLLLSAMTVDKIATFVTNDEVIRMAAEMRNIVIDILEARADEFDVNFDNLTVVVGIIDHFYFMNLTASRKGTLLEVLKPMMHREEIVKPQERPGFFSRILPGGQ